MNTRKTRILMSTFGLVAGCFAVACGGDPSMMSDEATFSASNNNKWCLKLEKSVCADNEVLTAQCDGVSIWDIKLKLVGGSDVNDQSSIDALRPVADRIWVNPNKIHSVDGKGESWDDAYLACGAHDDIKKLGDTYYARIEFKYSETDRKFLGVIKNDNDRGTREILFRSYFKKAKTEYDPSISEFPVYRTATIFDRGKDSKYDVSVQLGTMSVRLVNMDLE